MRLLRRDLGYNALQSSLSLPFYYSVDKQNAGSKEEAPNFKTVDVKLDTWSGLSNTSRRGERWVWNNGGKSGKTLLWC